MCVGYYRYIFIWKIKNNIKLDLKLNYYLLFIKVPRYFKGFFFKIILLNQVLKF